MTLPPGLSLEQSLRAWALQLVVASDTDGPRAAVAAYWTEFVLTGAFDVPPVTDSSQGAVQCSRQAGSESQEPSQSAQVSQEIASSDLPSHSSPVSGLDTETVRDGGGGVNPFPPGGCGMIDPKTLCNPPGRTRDDPDFVTRDYSTHRTDDAAKQLFWRVLVMLAVIWGVASVVLIGGLLWW